MDPIEAFENFMLTVIGGVVVLQLVLFICAPVIAIVIFIWWLQTLMLCLREEEGSDKTTYALVIVFLGPIGAIVYHLMRTGRVPGNSRLARTSAEPAASNWLAGDSSSAQRRRSPRDTGYTTPQVLSIAFAAVVICFTICCGLLFAYPLLRGTPPPILTARAATAQAPGPGIFPTSFSFDTSNTEAAGIMATISAISTQSAEVMMTSAAVP